MPVYPRVRSDDPTAVDVLPSPASPHAAMAAAPAPLDLVLDTNVVLDWLAFGHPVGAPLADALASGRCRWLCTRAMRDELADVVARDTLRRWAIDAAAVLALFDALAVDVGDVAPCGAAAGLRCADPDDQVFVDLALARGAHALLTRDRALLRLASRARRCGVRIATPEAWLSDGAGSSPAVASDRAHAYARPTVTRESP